MPFQCDAPSLLAADVGAVLTGGTKAAKVESLLAQQVNVPKKTIRDWRE